MLDDPTCARDESNGSFRTAYVNAYGMSGRVQCLLALRDGDYCDPPGESIRSSVQSLLSLIIEELSVPILSDDRITSQ